MWYIIYKTYFSLYYLTIREFSILKMKRLECLLYVPRIFSLGHNQTKRTRTATHNLITQEIHTLHTLSHIIQLISFLPYFNISSFFSYYIFIIFWCSMNSQETEMKWKKLLCVIKMKLQKYTKREREQERENSNLNQVSLEKTFCSFWLCIHTPNKKRQVRLKQVTLCLGENWMVNRLSKWFCMETRNLEPRWRISEVQKKEIDKISGFLPANVQTLPPR